MKQRMAKPDGIALLSNEYRFPSNFIKTVLPVKTGPKLAHQQVPFASPKDIVDEIKTPDSKSASPVPYQITPTFSWKNAPSDPSSTQIIIELCEEMIADLDNKDYDSVSKAAEEMALNLTALLAELPTESCKDEKSWISSLMLSLSKLLKNGFDSQADEMKLIVKGLSDAMNDLNGNVTSDDLDQKKYLYPSPQMPNESSTSLSLSQTSPISSVSSPVLSDLLLDRYGKVKAGSIGALLGHLKDYKRSGNIKIS